MSIFDQNIFQECLNDLLNLNIQFEQNCYEPTMIEYQELQEEQIRKQNDQDSIQQEPSLFEIEKESDDKKVDYKNLPKLIGNNFEKYLLQNESSIPRTKGLEIFLNSRLNKKSLKDKQVSTKISDLREMCQSDLQSQRAFIKYIKRQFIIDLVQSPKIENPLKYLNGISTYFATANQPEYMISSHVLRKNNKKIKKRM